VSIFRTIGFGAAAVAALSLLTACSGSGTTQGQASPTPSAAPAQQQGGAPHVPAPLPVDGLLAQPCDALSPTQVDQLGMVGPGKSEQTPTGPSCTWKSATSDANSISVEPVTINKNGLDSIYANKAKAAYFEPLQIDGYPAVYFDIQDGRSQGTCSLWVGATDELAVSVISQIGRGPNVSNPCPVAERTAKAMTEHLKGAA
jgi:hypothetical protein